MMDVQVHFNYNQPLAADHHGNTISYALSSWHVTAYTHEDIYFYQ